MNNVITLFEYSEKRIDGEEGFTLNQKEINSLESLNRNIKKFQNVNTDVVRFEYHKSKARKICTSSYVGVLRAGNKVIQILPKMARGDLENETNGINEEYSKQAIKNLLYMLAFTKKIQIKESDLASLNKVSDNFFEVLIFLFAKNLLDLIQNAVSKEYVTNESNLSYIKGKLQFSDHLKKNAFTKGRFYLRFDEFSEDNILNQIFKYTTHLLMGVSRNFNNYKQLQELQFLFNDITLRRINVDDFKKVSLTRLNKAYEPVLNLCKIFIGQSSLEMSADNIDTFTFVFDMNILFEEFIGEFIHKSFLDQFSSITLQRPVKHFVERKIVGPVEEDGCFQLRPDIQLGQEITQPEIIIDTKYKILDGKGDKKEGVSQPDLYQMNAYAKKYKCSNIILLYPRLESQEEKSIKFVIDNETNIHVRTVNLCRDLKTERGQFKNELQSVLAV